jgi:hypothetical protein
MKYYKNIDTPISESGNIIKNIPAFAIITINYFIASPTYTIGNIQ